MAILNIVPDLPARAPGVLAWFHEAALGSTLGRLMGWIALPGGPGGAQARLQPVPQGGSDTELPAASIKIDDPGAPPARLHASGAEPVYGPVTDPWGNCRLFPRAPQNNLGNVAPHATPRDARRPRKE